MTIPPELIEQWAMQVWGAGHQYIGPSLETMAQFAALVAEHVTEQVFACMPGIENEAELDPWRAPWRAGYANGHNQALIEWNAAIRATLRQIPSPPEVNNG